MPADEYDWCIVPDSGYDVIVFAGIAVIVACCFRGKFSNLMILVAGMSRGTLAGHSLPELQPAACLRRWCVTRFHVSFQPWPSWQRH